MSQPREILFVNMRRLELHYLPREAVRSEVQFVFRFARAPRIWRPKGTKPPTPLPPEICYRSSWGLLKSLVKQYIEHFKLDPQSAPIKAFENLDPLISRSATSVEIEEGFARLLEIRYWLICESGAYGGCSSWVAIPEWKAASREKVEQVKRGMGEVGRYHFPDGIKTSRLRDPELELDATPAES